MCGWKHHKFCDEKYATFFKLIFGLSCRMGYLRGGLFVTGIPVSPRASRWSKKIFDRDQRERQPKGYTSHEVTAPRVAGFKA